MHVEDNGRQGNTTKATYMEEKASEADDPEVTRNNELTAIPQEEDDSTKEQHSQVEDK
jgi:hypothetical protein